VHSVERDALVETLSLLIHLGMRQNCAPETEEFSFCAFVIGSSFHVMVEKQGTRSQSHHIYKQDAHVSLVEPVLHNMNDVEHIQESRCGAYMMKSGTARGACKLTGAVSTD